MVRAFRGHILPGSQGVTAEPTQMFPAGQFVFGVYVDVPGLSQVVPLGQSIQDASDVAP